MTSKPFTSTLRQLLLEDPIYRGLWEGTLAWGDVPFEDGTVAWCDIPIEETPITPPKNLFQEEEVICCEEKSSRPAVPVYTVGIKTIITRNLPRDITVQKLQSIFEKYGPIQDIYIPKNADKSSPYFGTIKGFALIKFIYDTDSAKAFQNEYGRLTISNNRIAVEFAKEDRESTRKTSIKHTHVA